MADTVLIVEDNPLARRMLGDAFAAAGYRVLSAASGTEGLGMAQQEAPDLVLLDLVMPEMDGLEVCRRIRRNPRTARLVVVMLTVSSRLEDKLEAFRAGVDDFLSKPVDTRELVARVGATMARAQRNRSGGDARRGKLFTFFSAKGGVGTTSLCVNTGAALAQLQPSSVVVADLVLPLGSVRHLVGIEPRSTLADLARGRPEELTPTLLEDHLLTRDSLGFQLLLGFSDPKDAQQLTPDHVVSLLLALREVGTYSLVDVGRTLSRISLPIITESERLIVVLSPDPMTLQLTRVCLSFFREMGVPPKRLVLVLSLPVGQLGMARQRVEDFLGTSIFGVIPHEPDKFMVSANQGAPLVQREPDCAASLQIFDLARLLRRETAVTAGI